MPPDPEAKPWPSLCSLGERPTRIRSTGDRDSATEKQHHDPRWHQARVRPEPLVTPWDNGLERQREQLQAGFREA